jgi:imidazolonepropionase
MADDRGTLEVGKAADLCIWDIEEPAELAYRIGFNPLAYAVKAGRVRN